MLAASLLNRKAASPFRGGGFSFGSFLDEPNDTRPDFAPGEPRAPRPGEPRTPRVEAPQPAQINTYQLGTVEVTAPRQPDYNPTVAIVSAEDMKKQGALDAGEALRYTPGIFYMPTPATYANTVYIRGFGEDESGFYFDGIPIGDIYAGNSSGDTDLFQFFTFGLGEIQVSKGYTSPAFSAGKMGGAINMVSSIPVRNLEVNLGYKFIANNEHRINAQAGRNLGNQYFQLSFSYLNRKSLNYSYDYSGEGPKSIASSARSGYNVMGKYGFFLGDNHEYSLNFYHMHLKRGDADIQHYFPYYDKTALYLLGDSRFSDSFSLNSKIWYTMNLNQNGNWDSSSSRGAETGSWSKKYDDYSIGITETFKFDFSENQNLKAGFIVKNERHRAYAYWQDTTQQTPREDWSVLNHSYFAEYALRANDMLRFAISGSYDRHDGLSAKNKVANTPTAYATTPVTRLDNKHLWGWTLQGIAYFNPIEPLTFHANVGHKTNLPKIRGLYSEDSSDVYAANNSLTSESLLNYELGVDFNHRFETLGTSSFGATAYFHDISNMIVTTFVDSSRCASPTTDGCVMLDNAPNGYSVGGEIYAKQGFWGDALTLGVNWSYLKRRSWFGQGGGMSNINDGDKYAAKREFTTHPRQNINMLVQIAPSRDYDINLNGSVQTSRWAYDSTADTYVKLPTVVLFDLTTNYRLTKRLSLTAGAYNLFDRNYNYSSSATAVRRTVSAFDGGFAGRRVFAGFEYNYHR